MARIFLSGALRSLLRHKLQSLINIASLAIGLAVFGFALLYVKQELGYNQWPEAERVHRLIVEQRGIPGVPDSVALNLQAGLWPRMRDYFAPQIEHATRAKILPVTPVDPQESIGGPLLFVDPEFLNVFSMEVVEGDLARVLSGPGIIALEASYAERIGYRDGIGGRVAMTSYAAPGTELEYEVGAIYRLPQPADASLRFWSLTLMHPYSFPLFGQLLQFQSWDNNVQVWVKLRPDVSTEAFNALQPDFVQQEITTLNDALGPNRKVSDHVLHRWQPLSAIHFNPLPNEAINDRGAGDPARVATFAIVGLLVLLVGCSNSISLSLAAALERRREIGVRKAAGALQQDILQQQLGEAVLLAMIALVPAIAMLELLQPAFQALMPFAVQIDMRWTDYALMLLIACVTGLASGAYPAFVLSSTRPQAVLKAGAQESTKRGPGLRGLLVGAQFCFASMLLIGTTALYLQLAVTRAQPLGYDVTDTLFVAGIQSTASADAIRAELVAIPGVSEVIRGVLPPNMFAQFVGTDETLIRSRGAQETTQVNVVFGYYGFIDFTRMRVLAGRAYDEVLDKPAPATGAPPTAPREERLVINRSAARALGFATPEEAVGQLIFRRATNNQTGQTFELPRRIIGVVEDNMYFSLRRRPGPQTYQIIQGLPDVRAMVRYEPSVADSIQQRVRDAIIGLSGQAPGGMTFMEDQVRAAFVQEQNESRLLLICGGIALVLASFGLYGLAAFMIERQVKEVGIRKAMGAHVTAIVTLYLWRFGRPIVLAGLLAWPVAIYFVLGWIERFPYQMERGWLLPICIGALGAVLAIALLTVSLITTRAAMMNPVRSLRYE
jgi:putative ABC transport system permease protein